MMLLSSAVSILILLASPFIVLSNLLIISVWLRFKRLRTPSNALIISLAAADLGFGLFLPVAVALDLTFPINEECSFSFCIGPFAVLLTFCAASLLSMTAIGLDRFTSVSQPLRYNHFVTMSNVQKFICACWTYAVVLGIGIPLMFIRHIGAEVVIGWLAIFLYGPCLVSAVISYGYIYVIARNHARAIYSVEVSLHNGSTCEITDTATLGHSNRYGLTLAMILGSIIGCWLPIQVCAFVDLFSGNMILMDRQWRLLAALPLVVSSFMNPWLYGYRSSEVRLAIIRLIDSIVTKITGRPPSVNILYTYHKGDLTSCASNVRLLAISPSQTTVQCCSPSPNCERKQSNLSIHLMICDQVSSL